MNQGKRTNTCVVLQTETKSLAEAFTVKLLNAVHYSLRLLVSQIEQSAKRTKRGTLEDQ